MKTQSAFGFALTALVISIITMILFFVKVSSNSVVDGMTFISVIAAFIGISVTLVIGFQIYSSMTIKDKLAHIDSINKELLKTKKEIIETEIKLKGELAEAQAKSYAKINDYSAAFTNLHTALRYYCNIDLMKEVILPLFKLLKVYGESISIDEFDSNCKNHIIDTLFISLNLDYSIIKETKYYWIIKDDYEKLFSQICNLLNSYKDTND